MSKSKKYKNIVLSSGGVKGISQIGALQKLIDCELIELDKIEGVIGSSVGSLIGLCVTLGFTIQEIWEYIYGIDTTEVIKPNAMLLLTKGGIDNGQFIYNMIENKIYEKTQNRHINFKQLYQLTNIDFKVIGSCLTTKECVVYDHINTPTFKVAVAVRISVSVPGILTPVTINNKKYIDGAVINNYPMELFEDRIDDTIGILINDNFNTDCHYPEEYFLALMNLFMYQYYKNSSTKYEKNTIVINNKTDVPLFSFGIKNKIKEELYQNGMNAVENFINENQLNNVSNEPNVHDQPDAHVSSQKADHSLSHT